MIGKREKKEIIKVLGAKYSSLVLAHLNELGIKKNNNRSFTPTNIRHAMIGYRENEIIESAIFDLVKKTKQKEQQKKEERMSILGIKKTVATTTV